MSYLRDKVPCTGCKELFDPDLLNAEGKCRDCVIDDEMLDDLKRGWRDDETIPSLPYAVDAMSALVRLGICATRKEAWKMLGDARVYVNGVMIHDGRLPAGLLEVDGKVVATVGTRH